MDCRNVTRNKQAIKSYLAERVRDPEEFLERENQKLSIHPKTISRAELTEELKNILALLWLYFQYVL